MFKHSVPMQYVEQVPDLTQLESRLWFYFVGTSWILQGIEGLHVGQIMLMSKLDAKQGMILTADVPEPTYRV